MRKVIYLPNKVSSRDLSNLARAYAEINHDESVLWIPTNSDIIEFFDEIGVEPDNRGRFIPDKTLAAGISRAEIPEEEEEERENADFYKNLAEEEGLEDFTSDDQMKALAGLLKNIELEDAPKKKKRKKSHSTAASGRTFDEETLFHCNFRFTRDVVYHFLDIAIYGKYGRWLPFTDVVPDLDWLKVIHAFIDPKDTMKLRDRGSGFSGGRADLLRSIETGYLYNAAKNLGLNNDHLGHFKKICENLPGALKGSNINQVNTKGKFVYDLMNNILSLYRSENQMTNRAVLKWSAIERGRAQLASMKLDTLSSFSDGKFKQIYGELAVGVK